MAGAALPLLMGIGAAVALALGSRKSSAAPAAPTLGPDGRPTSGTYSLDAGLPSALEAQALGTIKNGTAAECSALADRMDAQGYHLTAAALRKRAAELAASPVAPTAPPAAPAPPTVGPPSAPAAPNFGAPAAPPVGPAAPQSTVAPPPTGTQLSGLDAGMDAQTRQAVVAALTTETDPAKLQGFAGTLRDQYPIAAGLLWAKAAAMIAQQQPVLPSPALPAPPPPTVAPAGPGTPIWPGGPASGLSPQAYVQWALTHSSDIPQMIMRGLVPPGFAVPAPPPPALPALVIPPPPPPGVIQPPSAPAPTPAPPAPAPAGYTWRLATNADVAADGVQPRYQALLSQPVGTEVQEMHNGRLWKFRVVSSATDPGLTTFAKDVKGWIAQSSAAPTPAPAPLPTVVAPPAPVFVAPPVQQAVYPQPSLTPLQQAAHAMNQALLAHGYKQRDMPLYAAVQRAGSASVVDGFPGQGTMLSILRPALASMGETMAPVTVYPWHGKPGNTGYDGMNAPTWAEWTGTAAAA